jgi:predicted XRE-type DNA-binding protein
VLTSRENPEEIVELEAKALAVRSWTIQGLEEVDARQIFESKGLSDKAYWGELINVFEAHPLALQIVSARIQSVFGGKVSEFLKQQTITQRAIADLLEQQFNCLSDLEKKILIAIKDKPISFSDLKESMEISGSQLLNGLESLRRRALIQGEALFTLDPVVKKYIDNNKFVDEKLPLKINPNRDNIKKLPSG